MSAPKDAAPLATPEAPWLGLRSFTEFAQGYFFGRGAELEDLFERIVDKPLTVLFGRSGLGKSSLLQASLTPRLRERGFLPVLIRFDHAPEATGLGEQMLRKLLEALRSEGWGSLADRLTGGIREAEAQPEWNAADFLWLIFHDPVYDLLPGRTDTARPFPRPVFLIDQFEEIFTLGDRPVRRPVSLIFREALSSLVENRPPSSLRARLEKDDALVERIVYQAHPARVLLSLREDFLHVLERWRRSIPSLMENRFELRTLSGHQAFEAVVLPGQLRQGAPPIIPDEVGQAIVRFVAGVKGDVPLAEIDAVPPLLSLVCAELNAQRIVAGQPQITRAQFEGHSDEILLSFYNRSFEPASYGTAFEGHPGAEATLRQLQRLIEDRLVSPDGFRENIAFDTIARDLARGTDPETAKVAMDKIVERRLLTVEERGGVRRLELAHDVLAPIVRASRDERQEKEAVASARRDQERAEAETRKALHQRNRLRRWVGLSLVLAFLAVAAAVGAWLETKKAREAADSSIETLKAIYDDYVANSLENTPSVSAPQAKLLKSNLTTLLLSRSRDLYANQPGIRGTTDYMARLLVDQGRDATYDDHFSAADSALTEAMEWAKKQPLDSAASAELRADILLEQARVPFISGDQAKTIELANAGLSEVHAMEAKWPDSWRLPYVEIRLENVLHANDKGPGARAKFLELAARLDPLIKKSNNDFDPAFWRFAIESNSFRVAGTFTRSPGDFAAIKDHVIWFREHLVLDRGDALAAADQSRDSLEKIKSSFQDELSGSNDKSGGGVRRVIQLDTATENLKDFLGFLADQFSAANDPSTVEARRSILGELERTMTLIESSLPPGNLSAYDAREKVLQLEESGKKDGANFLAPSELSAEEDKHASLRSSLVSTENVTEILVPAFKEYAADNADAAAKASALGKAGDARRLFDFLDFGDADTVLHNLDLIIALEKVRAANPSDPLVALDMDMVDHYADLYRRAGRETKVGYLDSFCGMTVEMLEGWFSKGEYDKVTALYHDTFRVLPIAKSASRDRSYLILELRLCIMSLLKTDRFEEGRKLLGESLALCDSILADGQMDWYTNSAYRTLCFEVARTMKDTGHPAEVQPLLLRGWTRLAALYGREGVLERVHDLPFEGDLPVGASPEDTAFFAMFATGASGTMKAADMQRFNIPCDFGGTKSEFSFYIISGPNGLSVFLDQVRWLKDVRGGTVPKEVVDGFTALWKIAVDKKVSFPELCNYALGTSKTDENGKPTPVPSKATGP